MSEELCKMAYEGQTGKVESMLLAKPANIQAKDEDERTVRVLRQSGIFLVLLNPSYICAATACVDVNCAS